MTYMRKIINLLDYREKPEQNLNEDAFASFNGWANGKILKEHFSSLNDEDEDECPHDHCDVDSDGYWHCRDCDAEGQDSPLEEETAEQTTTFTGPAYWASYLVNNDSSGLEPDEILEADKWKEGILPYHVQDVARDANGEPEEPHFSIHFDLHSGTDYTGGNVVDYVCGKHDHAIDEGYDDFGDDDEDFEPWDEDEEPWEDEEDFPDDPDEIRGIRFADPGGHSALRAASSRNPRNCPCPTCGWPNRLTPADERAGYQCNDCATAIERGGEINYYEGDLDEGDMFDRSLSEGSDLLPERTEVTLVKYIPDDKGFKKMHTKKLRINSLHAVKGKTLRIKGENGEWEDGWKVYTVHPNRTTNR